MVVSALRLAGDSAISFQLPGGYPWLGVLGSALLRVAEPGEDKGLGSMVSCMALDSVAGLQSAGPSWGDTVLAPGTDEV